MIYYLGIAVLAVYISASSALPPCMCTRNLKPVCGSDNVTYNNECMLECKRSQNRPELTVAKQGRCERNEPCVCPYNYSPVCGSDGLTYPNSCSLACESRSTYVQMAHKGACKAKREVGDVVLVAPLDPCVCTREKRPVCGSDDHTYSNRCLLRCAQQAYRGLEMKHVGPCAQREVVPVKPEGPSCTCTRNFEPVCASDGRTYANECMMKCAGEQLTVDRQGECDGDS